MIWYLSSTGCRVLLVKYTGLCFLPSSYTKTEPIAECVTTRCTNNRAWINELVNTGRIEMSFLIWVNMCSHVSSHRNAFAPFSRLKNGFDFSASFVRKRERAANFPFNYCTFFRQVGLLIANIASHLSGFASMPLWAIINSRNLPPVMSKKYFSGFRRISCLLTFEKTPSRSVACCSALTKFTTMSSTYTSMVLPNSS